MRKQGIATAYFEFTAFRLRILCLAETLVMYMSLVVVALFRLVRHPEPHSYGRDPKPFLSFHKS